MKSTWDFLLESFTFVPAFLALKCFCKGISHITHLSQNKGLKLIHQIEMRLLSLEKKVLAFIFAMSFPYEFGITAWMAQNKTVFYAQPQ